MPKAATRRSTGRAEVARLRARLAEAEETLGAIRRGDVDAIAVDGPKGRRIFTLQGADEPYRIMLERMNEGAASLSKEGTIVFCNSRLAEMLGEPQEKLLGAGIFPFVAEGCRTHFKATLARGIRTEAREELLMQRADGSVFPAFASLKSIPFEGKRNVCLVLSDLTERQKMERSLRESEAKFSTMFMSNPAMAAVTEANDGGRFLDVNRAFEEVTGYARSEVIGKTVTDLDLWVDPAPYVRAVEELRVRQSAETEMLLRRKDGEIRTVFISAVLTELAGRTLALSTGLDITDRKRAEEALKESKAELQLQFNRMPIGCITWDKDFCVRTWNPAAEQIFGFLAADAIGKHPYEFLVPREAQAGIDDIFTRLTRGDTYAHSVNENLTKDGRTIVCRWTNTPLRDEQGKFVSILSMVEDITAQKDAEDTLRRQATLLNLAHDAVFVRDLDGRVASWNRGAVDLYGWTEEQAQGKITHQLLQTVFPASLESINRRILKAREWEGELRHTCRDGKQVVVASRWSLLRDEKGNPSAVLEVNRDITARKAAEESVAAERQKFNTILDSVPPYVCLLTPDYHVAFANREFCRRFGEHQGRKCYDFLFNRTVPCEVCETFKVLTDDKPRKWQWTGPDGCHYDIFDFPFTDTDGSKLILEMGIDVTEQRKAQTALEAERKRFESVLDGLPAMICLLTPEYKVAFANKTFRKAFGESEGRKCYEYCFGKTAPCEFCESFKVLQTGKPHDWEVVKDGHHIHAFDMPFSDVDGSPLILEMDLDVTEQREAEEKLRRSEAELREAQRVARLGSWTMDTKTGKVTWTEELYRMLGLDPSQPAVSYQDQARLFTAESWSRLSTELDKTVRTESRYELELETVLPDGQHRWMLARGEPVGEEGRVTGLRGVSLDITERKQAELARRESEKQFSTLADLVPQFVWMCTPDGLNFYFNRRWYEYTGLSEEESYGRGWNSPFHPDDKQAAWNAWNHATATGETYQVESRLRAAEGSYRWFLMRGTPMRDESGKIVRWFGTCTDIHDMKQASEALQLSEARYRHFIEENAAGFIRTNAGGTILDCNAAAARMFGYESTEGLLGSSASDLYFNASEREQLQNHLREQRALANQEIYAKKNDGSPMWALVNFSITEYRGESDYAVQATFIDITETREAHQKIRSLNETLERRVKERTAELQAFFDTVPIGLAITNDPEGQHIRGNPAMEQMLGAAGGGELSRSAAECAPYRILKDGKEQPPEDLPMQRAARGETVAGEPMEITRADGKVITVHSVAAPLFDEQRRPRGAVGAFLDITPLKRAEAALRESERAVRRKLDSILLPEGDLGNLELSEILDTPVIDRLLKEFYAVVPVTTGLLDLRGKVLAISAWQEACVKFHRAHPESCKNCIESDLQLSAGVPPGQFKLYKCKNNLWDAATPIIIGDQHLGNLYFGQFFFTDETVDYNIFREQAKRYGFDEREYLKAIDAVPRISREVFNASMTFLATFARVISQLSYSTIRLARSMTESKRVNERLASANNELESFTYAVAHDLRAPLRHIHGFAGILEEEAGEVLDDSAKHHLQFIQQGVERMSHLLEDLLNLSRMGRQELRLQVCGIRSLVDAVVSELNVDVKDRKVEWRIHELPFVKCDPSLTKYVLTNLLSNALKFTRPREHAVIEIGQIEKDYEPVIFVRDNGVGFDMKYASKLFGVFQRLHRQEDFEGTGVGLAIVERIVRKHGGRVGAESELNKGTTFYFNLSGTNENVGFDEQERQIAV